MRPNRTETRFQIFDKTLALGFTDHKYLTSRWHYYVKDEENNYRLFFANLSNQSCRQKFTKPQIIDAIVIFLPLPYELRYIVPSKYGVL